MSPNNRGRYPRVFSRARKLVPKDLILPTLSVERPVVSYDEEDINYLRGVHRVVEGAFKVLPPEKIVGRRIIRPTDFRMVQVQHTIASPKLAKRFTNGNTMKEFENVARIFQTNLARNIAGMPANLVLSIGNLSLINARRNEKLEATPGSEIVAKPIGWDVPSEVIKTDDQYAAALYQLGIEGDVHASAMTKVDPNFDHDIQVPKTALITSVGQISSELFRNINDSLTVENLIPLRCIALDPVLCLRSGSRRDTLAEISLRTQ